MHSHGLNLDFGGDWEMDHLGVAVSSIESALPLYRSMGWSSFSQEEVPTEKVKVAFISFKNHVNIELLEPTSPDSAVGKFIAKRGGGIHHVCLRTHQLEKVLAKLKNDKVRLIDEVPRRGAGGCRVAFIHPSSCGGVLIELKEK